MRAANPSLPAVSPNHTHPSVALLPGLLVLVLLGRALGHLALYAAGYEALTADEFGRVVQAAVWAQAPAPVWSGFWLPLQTYWIGVLLAFGLDWLVAPRLATIGLGLCGLAFTYQLARLLFGERAVGLTSALLLALNPVHIWLSAVPLAEVPVNTLLLAGLWGVSLYLARGQRRFLWAGALALMLANGLRYEAWPVTLVYSLFLLGYTRFDARARTTATFGWALVPWLVPAIWIIGNWAETGNPLYFYAFTRSYEVRFYGTAADFARYWQTLLQIDPWATALAVPGLMLAARRRRTPAVLWFAAATLLPFLAFSIVQGGWPAPEGQMLRRMGLLLFPFYPFVGYAVISGGRWLAARAGAWPARAVLVGGLVLAGGGQIDRARHFQNDPSADGLPVGADAAATALFDRPLNDADRAAPSLLQTEAAACTSCLAVRSVSHVFLKTAELRALFEQRYAVTAFDVVQGYSVYRVPALAPAPAAPCPLPE